MKAFSNYTTQRHCVSAALVILISVVAFSGCGKPGNSGSNFTNSVVSITSINENTPFQSDVLTEGSGTDDVISATFKSAFRADDGSATAPDGPTVFDSVTLHTYHVGHQRSDGGPTPADFTSGIHLTIAPNSESEANFVLVRAFDKHRSPLEELRDDGEIFTSTIITFYGEDGYGNDVTLSVSLAISYANFPDQ